MDPRPAVIDKRLAAARRIVAVTGGKGGIGKSSIASVLALVLARRGLRTGLLDLDLTAPSDHVILGASAVVPHEERGIEPPLYHGVRFMSVTCFLGAQVTPLRGVDLTNALLEILAITRWGELDVLVIDMPPGLGDAALDVARLMRRAEYLVVAGRSRVVLETVGKTLRLLEELRVPVLGVLENMRHGGDDVVRSVAERHGVRFLGAVPFDESLENAGGDVDALARTAFAAAVDRIGWDLFAAARAG